MSGYTYIMTNKTVGTLYIGVTSDLARRVWEHKNDVIKGSFTSKHKLHKLVWYESYDDITEAIKREKCIKEWHRPWKVRLIEKMNPKWDDLYESLNQ